MRIFCVKCVWFFLSLSHFIKHSGLMLWIRENECLVHKLNGVVTVQRKNMSLCTSEEELIACFSLLLPNIFFFAK